MAARDDICSAICFRRLIEFTYDGHSRTIEPHVAYPDRGENWYVEGWLVRGHSKSQTEPPWRRYAIDEIPVVAVLRETFTGTRPPYKSSSTRYDEACCKL